MGQTKTKTEPDEKVIARDALRTAAVEVNRLWNTHSATGDKLVKLRLDAKRLAKMAKGQTAEKSTLAEIRATRDKLAKVAEKLRELADAEAELIAQHDAACEVLKVKWQAYDAQDAYPGPRVGINASLKQMGVSLSALPDMADKAAGDAEAIVTELTAKGI